MVGYESDTVAYFPGMSWGFMRNTSIMAGTNKYAIKTIVKRIIHSLHTYTTVDKTEANESLLYHKGSPTQGSAVTSMGRKPKTEGMDEYI